MEDRILTDEQKEIEEKAAKKRADFAAEIKIKTEKTVFIRHPKNGYVMSCSPELAEILLRKTNKIYLRVTTPPLVDLARIREEI